ncbi:capsular glucan synthase [Komagataeibacter europaeus]|uniref:Capsular glucan synthase n=1 Tax=Komagataeibacter europaeus TaxID=33995 RepID=A0A0M0ECJ6_KOMEU|nr:glycosyltransferase family 1 protein [Komagataeibacter europaeus]KON62948.1 capsular glucan synthase [Komagataeibacter europaeus]
MFVKSSFRIGLDGFNLSLEKGTGVATYARTLSRALSGLGCPVDALFGLNIPTGSIPTLREVRFFDKLVTSGRPKSPAVFSKRWFRERKADLLPPKSIEIPITGRVDSRSFSERLPAFDRIFNVDDLFRRAARHFRQTGKFTAVRMENPPDIMHWTYPFPIEVEGAANIYTLHDVVPLRLPHTTLDDKAYYFRLLQTVGTRASGVCTVSEASKADILSFFPGMASRLHNTYQACDTDRPAFHRPDSECLAEIQADFGLSRHSYFIFFGSLEPKKNIGRVIEAFLASRSSRKLILVGAMAWKSDRELRYLEHGISTGRIMMIDYLPERTLFSLLRQARALLFPSLSEGFGLPVIEAMHCGVPVLTSREGALPEVGGDATLHTEAYDVDAITSAIQQLDQDDSLCEQLVAKGYQQVRKFDMASYQKRLIEMYRSVLSTTSTV